MRLLPVRPDHGGSGVPQRASAPKRRRHRRQPYQYLPLRHVCAHPRRDPPRCRADEGLRRRAMNQIVTMNRRQFVVSSAAAGSGLAISVALPRFAEAAAVAAQPYGAEGTVPEINAFLAVHPDGTVLIRSPPNEMGQGAITALPMIVAEELECDWSKMKVEYASAARNLRDKDVYGAMATVGSRGVRTSWQMLQQAGASARERLIAAAAQKWNVPVAECVAANSKVTHQPSGRSLDYGALAADAAQIKLDKEPVIRTPDKYKLMGKALPRLDTSLKINGAAKFAGDPHAGQI